MSTGRYAFSTKLSRNGPGTALRLDLLAEFIQELHLPCYAVSIPILGKLSQMFPEA